MDNRSLGRPRKALGMDAPENGCAEDGGGLDGRLSLTRDE